MTLGRLTPSIRLTHRVGTAGCAAKGSPELVRDLLEATRGRQLSPNPEWLLLGLDRPDDAAVIHMAEGQVVFTVDVMPPIVDDPFDYGAIAAANSLSDVYAMGARPVAAVAIVAVPIDLPIAEAVAITEGGLATLGAAGVLLVGGHTVLAAEPLFGYAVLGVLDRSQALTKGNAEPGDYVYLSKPLGTGLIATSAKFDEASADDLRAAVACMRTLNDAVSSAIRSITSVHAMTDVSGYGLLGAASEVAEASNVTVLLSAGSMPLLPSAARLASSGSVTGGSLRNRDHFLRTTQVDPEMPSWALEIVLDPQTSGGLLVFSAEPPQDIQAAVSPVSYPLVWIGRVLPRGDCLVRVQA